MVECKVMKVDAAIGGDVLDWSFKTDLPVDSIIQVSCLRDYEDSNGRVFQWPIFEDRVFCRPVADGLNGAQGRIELVPSEAEAIPRLLRVCPGLEIRSIVDDAVRLRCHLVPYQRVRLADFGEGNRNLVGPDVYQSGERRFVTKELSLPYPSIEYQRATWRELLKS
jgi:hypothetical protein